MKVSVVVPAWNVEKYLNKCLDSVMAQTFTDFECIVADDGSQDRTEMIIDSYMAQDARVKRLKLEHMGASATRNAALAQATGEYVLCLDADDWLEPDALALLVERMDADSLDMLLFNCDTCFENKELKEKFWTYSVLGNRQHSYQDEPCPGAKLLQLTRDNGEYTDMVCLYMLRRGLLAEFGLRFIEGILLEDVPFTFSCLLCAKRAGVLDRILYHRFIRSGSTTTTEYSSEQVRAWYTAGMKEMFRVMGQCGPFSEQVQRSVDITLNFARFLGKRA